MLDERRSVISDLLRGESVVETPVAKMSVHVDKLAEGAAFEAPRWDEMFELLVAREGKSETLEGEIFRAYNKLAYRYYNDGDKAHSGYGIETAGSAFMFLQKFSDSIPGLAALLDNLSTEVDNKKYQTLIDSIGKVILGYAVSAVDNDNLTPNTDNLDMLDYSKEAIDRFGDPNAYDDEEYDDDYDEEETWGSEGEHDESLRISKRALQPKKGAIA